MKILVITPYYFPAVNYGGPIFSIHNLNKALARKGVEVCVLTTDYGLKKNKEIVLNKWLDLDGIKIKYLKYYFHRSFTFSPMFFFAILKEIKKYDLVYITPIWNFTTLTSTYFCMLYNKPYIISPRGSIYKKTIEVKSPIKKKIYLSLFGKNFLKKASSIHYTNIFEKEDVENYLGVKTKSFVISNGIDLKEFSDLPKKGLFKNKYPLLKDKKYILFLSRIHKIKGLDLLIPAFKEVSLKYNDLHLVIAGPNNDDYKKEIEDLARFNQLENRILFTGMLNGKNKLSAYVDAEVFILPSYSENFGMVVAEAMACGTPVIISNKVGIYKEVLDYKAGVVTSLDVDNIKDGILKVLENSNLTSEIVSNAYKLVKEKYDVDIVADEIIKVFQQVIENKKKVGLNAQND